MTFFEAWSWSNVQFAVSATLMSDRVNTWSDGIFRRGGSAYSSSSLRSGMFKMRLSARNAIEMLMLPLNPVDSLAARRRIPRDEAGFYPRRKARKDSWKSIFDSVIMSLCSALRIPALWTFLVIRVQRVCYFFPPFFFSYSFVSVFPLSAPGEKITPPKNKLNKFTWFLCVFRKKNTKGC